MATLPPLTFQPLPEEDAPVVATGRTRQEQLQMHGVAGASSRVAKKKKRHASEGFCDPTFLCVFCIMCACGLVFLLLLALRDSNVFL